MRLDAYLAAHGLSKSRTHARYLIEGGFVTVNGSVITKPSFILVENTIPAVEITGEPYPYVGRGGLKLEAALSAFKIDVGGMTAIDVGASTGGFTDCLLRGGAKKVFAVDAGTGQLAQSLLQDSRVVNIEQFNARNLSPATLGELCGIAVADLSFISQTYVLPNIASVLYLDGIYIGLIKPQFECGRAALDRRGIVRSPKDHAEAIRRVSEAAVSCGLSPMRLSVSPILGGDGNREFLILCHRTDNAIFPSDFENQVSELVKS